MNIILTGFMGSGKTTFGKKLAQRSGFTFLDMDAKIEAQAGMPIVDIFSTHGEPYFRALEHTFLQSLSQQENLVLSTGGGIVLNPNNMAILKQCGTVVFLSPPPEVLLERLANDTTRPVIAGKTPDEILDLYRTRLPFYQKYADMTLTGDAASMEQLLQYINEHTK